MQTKEIKRKPRIDIYESEQKEIEAMLSRILGKYGEPRRPLKVVREEVAKQLEGISASRMVIEAR